MILQEPGSPARPTPPDVSTITDLVPVPVTSLPTGHGQMIRYVAIAAIAFAGVMHLIIAPGHFPHAFPHGVFFILTGTAQLYWALAFWRQTSPILYWAGLAASGGTISIWILTQLVSAPFALTADVIDPLAVGIISGELVGFVALVGLMGRGQLAAYTGRPVAFLFGGALLIALVFGTGIWGGGRLAEVIFPALGTSGVHDLDQVQAHGVLNRPPATPSAGPTPDLEAMIADAVEAASAARPVPTPVPGEDSDIQGMIAAAVEAALTAQPMSTPTPGEDLDIQGIIAAAVEAALTAQPTPGEDLDIQGMIAAAVEAALTAPPTSASAPGLETSPPQHSPTPVPVGAPASGLWGGKATTISLAIIGLLVGIAALGVWRTWRDL